MRSRMSPAERNAHDQAWGLDFGDPQAIRTELTRGLQSERGLLSRLLSGRAPTPDPGGQKTFADHPMCLNMLPKIEGQLQADSSIATATDGRGWTLLHSESLAGNLGVVRLLVRYGAPIGAQTPDGRDAAALARSIGWDELASYLSDDAAADQAG
jgi:hypothetical protein